MTSQMTADDELGQHLVLDGVDRVLDDAEHIETRQDGLRELNVLLEGDGRVVSSSDRVGGGENGASSLE